MKYKYGYIAMSEKDAMDTGSMVPCLEIHDTGKPKLFQAPEARELELAHDIASNPGETFYLFELTSVTYVEPGDRKVLQYSDKGLIPK